MASEHFRGHLPTAEVQNPEPFVTRTAGPKLASHFRSRGTVSPRRRPSRPTEPWTGSLRNRHRLRYLLNSTIHLRLLGKLLPLTLLILASGCAFETADDESDLYPDDELAESDPTGVAQQPWLVDEVDFPGFVGDQINGTFQSDIEVSLIQMREYTKLINDAGAPPP